VLGVLGVSREDIADDFMLTGQYYDSTAGLRRRIVQAADVDLGELNEEALLPIFSVERSYIDTALDLIEEAGGAEALLTARAGVQPQNLQRLRAELLE
jgi:hypothetical protein